MKHRVGEAGAIPEGGRLVVEGGASGVGIFRSKGRLHAYENACPHQGGPVCQGTLLPAVRETGSGFAFDESEPRIVCPWHGYEFGVETGCHPASDAIRLTPVEVTEDDGGIWIEVEAEAEARAAATQQITIHTDSREILKNARLGLDDCFIVDCDSHHVELDNWGAILDYIDDPVLRHKGKTMSALWPNARNVALSNHPPGLTFQDVGGRIPHQAQLAEHVPEVEGEVRDLTLIRRAMEAMGIQVQVVFPQPMLEIGFHPSPEIETQLIVAYCRWFCDHVLAREERVKSMLPLPFSSPEASLRTVREFAGRPGVVGFVVTGQRQAGLFQRAYDPLYRELEERGLPLGFHAGPDYMLGRQMNRFVSVHSISFVTCNMVHLTNWIMNGLPERFPRLKTIWIESGLAWLPFMMQRLDHEFLMRQSEVPLLRRLPSEYMREMYYTSQPMEASNMKLLEATLEVIGAETQLLYASDWPHWDFDPPSRIAGLGFLSERAKRNILGETARRLFRL